VCNKSFIWIKMRLRPRMLIVAAFDVVYNRNK
jgi:hypothetical protein